jgi:hypothetical protein
MTQLTLQLESVRCCSFLAKLAPLTAADRMFTQVLADERVKNYFSSTDMVKQKAHQVGNRDPAAAGGGGYYVGIPASAALDTWQDGSLTAKTLVSHAVVMIMVALHDTHTVTVAASALPQQMQEAALEYAQVLRSHLTISKAIVVLQQCVVVLGNSICFRRRTLPAQPHTRPAHPAPCFRLPS